MLANGDRVTFPSSSFPVHWTVTSLARMGDLQASPLKASLEEEMSSVIQAFT